MKNSFRNRMLAAGAAAAVSILLLSGFDSSLTVEDVMENTNAAIADMGGLAADVQGVADVSLDVTAGGQTQSLAASGTMDYSIQMIADPLSIAVSGSLQGDASSLGMSGGIELEMYMIEQEDGSGILYARMPQGEDTGWHAAAISAEDMSTLAGSITSSLSGDTLAAASSLGMDLEGIEEQMTSGMTLAPEAVNVNGTDCYEITYSIDGETLYNLTSQVVSAMPQAGIDEATLAAFQMLFSGIVMDGVMDSSVEDFAPVYAGIDLSGSDFSLIAQMFGGMMIGSDDGSETPEMNVTVNALNVGVSYDKVPEEIVVPAEALAAEIESTVSMSDMAEAATSAE